MRYLVRVVLLCVSLIGLASPSALASPIISGTIFMDPDIITASDPTLFDTVTYTGMGTRLMFDRRINAFALYNAFLFDATFLDGLAAEIQVNPEFGSSAAAMVEAAKYAAIIGQLPTALRLDVDAVWIHQGVEAFGGGNNSLLIHTGQADLYDAAGILEETFVHEAAHTSLDATHAASAGWIAAQIADADFISTYAMDFPMREDIAESFLPWLAVRYRSDRITTALADAIVATIPNRLDYFDRQGFAMNPVAVPEPGSVVLLGLGLVGVAAFRRRGAGTAGPTRTRDTSADGLP